MAGIEDECDLSDYARECVTSKVGAGGGVRGAGYQCERIPTCSYKESDSEGAEAQTLIAIKNSQ